jgi:hypothetical protein
MFVNIVLAAFDVYIGKKNLSTLRLIISSKVIQVFAMFLIILAQFKLTSFSYI